jgi:heme oxygenase
MRRLFASDYTLAEYGGHLTRLLGFFEPLHRAASRLAPREVVTHFASRTAALRQDLVAMERPLTEIDAVAHCTRLPVLTRDGIPGCLYVMLGSMLGGRVIAGRLQSTLGPAASLRFYGGLGSEGDARWAAFCSELDGCGPGDVPAICGAAKATFDAYNAWMQFSPGGGDAR